MRFENVWMRYGRREPWVLQEVDLELRGGDVAVVLGPNGAGKSTLLQVAAGVLRPVRGAVRDRPPVVGWVPERFPAIQPFTARGYLTRMAAIRGGRGAETIDRWAERLDCGRYLDVRLAELSKGTAQKVGLIQALLEKPDLLILDEPWEGLDAQTREQVPSIVAEVREAGGAVLVSDHRGETARLPGASHWHVMGGRVSAERELAPADRWVIEVAVAAADATATVARLRAAGHDILRIRES